MHATIIRHDADTENGELHVVLTVGTHNDFIAYYQHYTLLPNGGSGTLIRSQPWSTESLAIQEFEERSLKLR